MVIYFIPAIFSFNLVFDDADISGFVLSSCVALASAQFFNL